MKESIEGVPFVDSIYDFSGLWGTPSRCGLKVVKGKKHHIVIATELSAINPGTSVTHFCAELATRVCHEYGLDPEKLLFVEQSPERGSKLANYRGRFDIVTFRRDGNRLSDPDWKEISKNEIESLVEEEQNDLDNQTQ